MLLGEVQPNLRQELPHPAGDLEQPQPEGVELHPWYPTLDQPAAQRIQQPVGGGMQEQPELVGPEAVAAQAVGEAGVLEILDPQFGFAPIDIPVVEVSGGSERVVTTKRVLGPLGDLGFEDDPPCRVPRARLIPRFPDQTHLVRAGFGLLCGRLGEQVGGFGLEAGIGHQADGVVQVLVFTVVVERRDGEAAVGPQLDGDPGPALADQPHQPFEDGHHAMTGVDGAGSQDGGDELIGVPIEEEERVDMCWRK